MRRRKTQKLQFILHNLGDRKRDFQGTKEKKASEHGQTDNKEKEITEKKIERDILVTRSIKITLFNCKRKNVRKR